MSKLLSTFLFLFTAITLTAQSTYTGKVVSGLDGSGIPDATVQIEGTSVIISTDDDGVFKLNSNSRGKKVHISHVGFKTAEITMSAEATVKLLEEEVALKPLHLYQTSVNLDGMSKDLIAKYKSYEQREKYASYSQGWSSFYKSLERSILGHPQYQSTKHTAYLIFKVSKTGSISDVEVRTGSSRIEQIVKDAVAKTQNWVPAQQNKRPVAQKFSIQINFNNDVLWVVEHPAEPKIGYTEFYEYLNNELSYPEDAFEDRIEGKVYVQFEVYEDGSLHDVIVVKGLNPSCNREGVRLIKDGPDWSPPLQGGHPVKQRIVLPINFKLSSVKVVRVTEPKFPGGNTELTKFINNNKTDLEIPVPINKVNSTVILEFMVRKSGNLSNIRVSQSLGEAFDTEALRIYSLMPIWTPAMDDGLPINQIVTLPISFNKLPEYEIEQAKVHFDTGVDLFVKRDFDNAVQQFTEAITKNPQELNYYFNRAVAQFALNKFDKGCQDLILIKDNDAKALDLHTKYCTTQN